VVGLVIGLGLGVVISVVFDVPSMLNLNGSGKNTGAGTNNQVQMSGTVHTTQTGTIEFKEIYSSNNTNLQSSAPIEDGKYSVLLVGGKSYDVYVSADGYGKGDYSIYVPEGVTIFTANF
jgi:hypothetical protein